MQVFDNLHWLKGLMSNAFLYQEQDGWILVDTGAPGRLDPVAYLQQQGAEAEALKAILITHADVDHSGNLAAIWQQTGATIYASALATELLHEGRFPSHSAPLVDRLTPKLMPVEALDRVHITTVADGQVLPLMGGLHVIATPGHTDDHVAYWSPTTGILFAGDAVLSRGGRLSCSGRFISNDYHMARQSAVKLADLSPAIFACGHGKPYLHSYEDLMGLLAEARAG